MASGGLLSPSQAHHEAGGGQGHVLPWIYKLEVGDSVLALTLWANFHALLSFLTCTVQVIIPAHHTRLF